MRAGKLTMMLLALAAAGCLPPRSEPANLNPAGRHVVVLVPGWLSGSAQMRIISDEIRRTCRAEIHGFELSGLGVTGALPEYGAELRSFVAKLGLRPGDRLDLVGFSFGGLACRWYLEQLGGRAHLLVTVCTPHHGTTRGAWLPSLRSLREMQPGSEVIRRLHLSPRPEAEYHSIRLQRDTAVLPHCSSVLEGARNYALPGRTHQLAPYSRGVAGTIRAIYSGRAEPSGPQELTPDELRELGLLLREVPAPG